jgi:hypothetical protein
MSSARATPRVHVRVRAGTHLHASRRAFTTASTTLAASSPGDFFAKLFDTSPERRAPTPAASSRRARATNEVVDVIEGIRHKRLGGRSDIVVSELALGTQRWGGADFNSPDESTCHEFMDEAILGRGINLIDTAEQVGDRTSRSIDARGWSWKRATDDRRSRVAVSDSERPAATGGAHRRNNRKLVGEG